MSDDCVIGIYVENPIITIENDDPQIIAIATEGPTGPRGLSTWSNLSVTAAGTTVITPQTVPTEIEVDCTLGDITIHLPDSSTMQGLDLRIIRVDASPNHIHVLPFAGQFINSFSSYDDLYDQGECLQLNARTNLWRIV